MSWEPYTGRKVVCIRDDWRANLSERLPRRGEVYTIRGVVRGDPPHDGPWDVYLHLFEIVNPFQQYMECKAEMSFDVRAFRPLDARETSIECFQRLIAPPQPKSGHVLTNQPHPFSKRRT